MFLPLELPPGFARNNTEYQSKGRWHTGNLVRWYGTQVGPIPGSRVRSTNAVTGKCRRMKAWTDNTGTRWVGLATEQKFYVQNTAGTLFDLTPVGLTAGAADATSITGFGAGPFGSYTFGTPRPDTGAISPATVCSVDNWGQYLLFINPADGRLWQWQLNTAVAAAVVSGAPTNLTGVVVADDGFPLVYAGRTVTWPNQRDIATWTPAATNQAGNLDLQTAGQIVTGIRIGRQVLLLTDVDAHAANYLGPPFIWGFNRVGQGCGAISVGCAASSGAQVAWWGRSQFWVYDGAVRPLPCDVWDDLQANLNFNQRSKITAYHNAQNGEFWWHYPSIASTENDSYVMWSYRWNYWTMGTLARTAADEAPTFNFPLAVGTDGKVYEHEVGGLPWDTNPYVETIVELGAGDQVMKCSGIIGDEKTVGQCTLSGAVRLYPGAAETTFTGGALSSGRTDLRFSGRQARLRFSFTDAAARLGTPRLDLKPGGPR